VPPMREGAGFIVRWALSPIIGGKTPPPAGGRARNRGFERSGTKFIKQLQTFVCSGHANPCPATVLEWGALPPSRTRRTEPRSAIRPAADSLFSNGASTDLAESPPRVSNQPCWTSWISSATRPWASLWTRAAASGDGASTKQNIVSVISSTQ
jgi:hypothetical protein